MLINLSDCIVQSSVICAKIYKILIKQKIYFKIKKKRKG